MKGFRRAWTPPRAAAAALAASAAVLAASGIHAAVCVKLRLSDLCAHSAVVAEAEWKSSVSFIEPGTGRILTETRFAVRETFKGPAAEEIAVATPGGRVGDLVQHVAGSPVFSACERSILFLWRSPSGRLSPVGLAQGRFRLEKDAKGAEWFRASYSGLAFVDPATGRLDTDPKSYAPAPSEAAAFRKSLRAEIAEQEKARERAEERR